MRCNMTVVRGSIWNMSDSHVAMTSIVMGCTAAVAPNKTVQTIVNAVSCSRKSWMLFGASSM